MLNLLLAVIAAIGLLVYSTVTIAIFKGWSRKNRSMDVFDRVSTLVTLSLVEAAWVFWALSTTDAKHGSTQIFCSCILGGILWALGSFVNFVSDSDYEHIPKLLTWPFAWLGILVSFVVGNVATFLAMGPVKWATYIDDWRKENA